MNLLNIQKHLDALQQTMLKEILGNVDPGELLIVERVEDEDEDRVILKYNGVPILIARPAKVKDDGNIFRVIMEWEALPYNDK